MLAELTSADDLPQGWGVDVGPGHYRLRRRDDDALFGHSAGPQSWKQFLHPPRQRVWSSDGAASPSRPRGMPSSGCGPATWPRSRCSTACWARALIPIRDSWDGSGGSSWSPSTAPNPAACASARPWAPGPRSGPGYDLALTERIDDDGRRYVVDVGSDDGADVLAALPHRDAERGRDRLGQKRCRPRQPTTWAGRCRAGDLRELLIESRESPHWEEVASRCLTCGNCTMVVPTCFCTSVEDVTDLTGEHAERWMNWASCFEFDFSFVHEGSVRQSGPSRYRHWITHKLGTWHDQFGSSGCVGCGRCIAWCPTGIDITEEMNTRPAWRRKAMTDTATRPAPAPSAMTPVPYRVRSRIAENRDSATLQLDTGGRTAAAPQPGEFMMMYAFGIGEVAISVSGVPAGTDGTITHTIRVGGRGQPCAARRRSPAP